MAKQQQEIKRLYEQINAMKNRGTQASSICTTAGGGLTGFVCPHCAAVGRTAPHKNNSCYFNPKKMTERREWDRKFMDEKGVACNDDELRRGLAQTVVHIHSIKEQPRDFNQHSGETTTRN